MIYKRLFAQIFAVLFGIAWAGESAAKVRPYSLDHPMFNAMQQEMNRSLNKLKFEDFKPAYFLSYQISDGSDLTLSARYGSLTQDQSYRYRSLYVELRYGSYDLDNTDENYRGYHDSAPLEEDEAAIRHRLWLLTDQAYKQAVRDYLQKQGKKVSEIEKEKNADFSKETPHQTVVSGAGPNENLDFYKPVLKNVSSEFKKSSDVIDSGITMRSLERTLYYLNSENTKLVAPGSGNPYYIYLWARAQADDGMNMDVSRTFSIKTADRLPDEKTLLATARGMIDELQNLRKAKLTDPYTGPAILDAESTGVLFHEAIGHRLEGERQRDEDEGQTFKGQVGKEIIPAFLSVVEDPTAKRHGTQDLNGHYEYDDEAVKSQKVTLVENGVLKNFLMSRRPITGFLQSNGHGRAQFGRDPVARMSNLVITSSKSAPYSELKKMLLEECKKQNKPYGLLLKRTRSGDTFTGRGRYQAFRGTPEEVYLIDAKTGAETLVRGVELVGTPLITINKIIAAGKELEAMNAFCGAESGTVPVSTIAPMTLVKEVELQRVREDKQRPPILPPPLYDGE